MTILISSNKPGTHENLGIDFTHLVISLGLILTVFGGMEAIGIPIIHITSGVYHTTFKMGSPIIPYILGITVIPLVLKGTGKRKHIFAVAIMGMLLLVDLILGYSYSLPFSLLLWTTVVFLKRSVFQPKRIISYSAVLATAYVCLVGLHILIRPIIPLELPFLNGFGDTLWKAYSTLRWPAILMYTFFPYVLLFSFTSSFIRFRKVSSDVDESFRKEIFSERTSRLILVASIGLAIYLAVYNYLPKVNPGGYPSGVDITFYYTPSLRSMLNSTDPVTFAFSESFASTRPLYMLFLYSIHGLTGLDALRTVELASVILLPLLVASYYLLASRLFNLKSMGALAAILTLAGIQISVGIFTSYQANFLGLNIANLLAVIVLTVDRRKVAYPLVSLLSFCLMLIHGWTSLYYVTLISAVLTYRVVRNRNVEGLMRMILIIAFTMISVPFVSMIQQPTDGSTDPLYATQVILAPMFSFENLLTYWINTYSLFTEWFHGFMANAFLYLLAIIGVIRIRAIPEPAKTFLAMFPLTLLPLPLINYILGSRLYFNVPLQLYASIAVYPWVQDNSCGRRLMAILLSCLTLVYSLLAVANTGFFRVEL